MKVKVDVRNLAIGMYVHELDRPWLDTPFLFQGFQIESLEQIQDLQRYCKYVWVIDPDAEGDFEHIKAQVEPVYPDKTSVEVELVEAKKAHAHAWKMLDEVVHDIRKGDNLPLAKAKEAVDSMVESVVRNPDALLLLTRLKTIDSYTYGHAIDVSIYMLAFGRHLGYPEDQLGLLGLGGMLMDIGKLRLPKALLEKQGKLTAVEYEQVKQHVDYGVKMLSMEQHVSPLVMEIVSTHHERQDGSGYPRGLHAKQMSVYGNMAAIVDCYDALISHRPYAKPFTSYEALQMLYGWRGSFFHAELIEQFIQCLGIYPVGSLVELNSGEVGIVIAQSRVRRMKPKIMLILDANKKPYTSPTQLDLLYDPKAHDDVPYQIRRALEAGMYGIEPAEYYL